MSIGHRFRNKRLFVSFDVIVSARRTRVKRPESLGGNMARTRGSVGTETEKAIRKAAIELIAKHGFEAMTLRDLAQHVGLQSGSIYRYIATKDQLLIDIMVEHMEALLGAWRKWDDAQTDPRRRLESFVEFHIRYHFERQKEVLIANLEL